MHVRRVLAGGGGGKTENPAGIGVAVRQTVLDEPVEDAVERHAVD